MNQQKTLNLYQKTYTDTHGRPAYPWRTSAGFKFESVGATAFFQSQMNNPYILREFYKDSKHSQNIRTKLIHGDDVAHDLTYKTNYNPHDDSIGNYKSLMVAEFKMVTYEAVTQYGMNSAINHVFRLKDGTPNRALQFLIRYSNSYINKLNLLVIGMTNHSSENVVCSSDALVFGPIWCIAYMPTPDSRKGKVNVQKVVHMFDNYQEYARCVHYSISPQDLFETLEGLSHVDDTRNFLDTFKLP